MHELPQEADHHGPAHRDRPCASSPSMARRRSQAALRVAVVEAASRHTPLHLVTAIDVLAHPTPADDGYSRTARRAAQEAIAWARTLLGSERVDATIEVGAPPSSCWTSAGPATCSSWAARAHRPVARMFLGSTQRRPHHPGHVPRHRRQGDDDRSRSACRRRHRRLEDLRLRRSRSRPTRPTARGVPLRVVFAVSPVVDPMGSSAGPTSRQLAGRRGSAQRGRRGGAGSSTPTCGWSSCSSRPTRSRR